MEIEALDAIIERRYRDLLALPIGADGLTGPQMTAALKGAAEWWKMNNGGNGSGPETPGSEFDKGEE